MLFKMSEYVRRAKILGIPHRGVVLNNTDPKEIGRVKVMITGLLDDLDESVLPWVYPKYPFDLGSTSGHISTFMVPRIGSQVTVEFPYDDLYFGFYTGRWDTEVTKGYEMIGENYPDVYGFSDPTGNEILVNMVTHVININHSSGTTLTVSGDGSVTLNDVKNVQINAVKIELNAPDDQSGVITMESYDPFLRRDHIDGSTTVFAGHD